MMSLKINGAIHELDVDPDMPLLWVLRDVLHLTGTKYSCGIGQCGACSVLIDGEAVKSCRLPVKAVKQQSIVTIEGLDSSLGKTIQQAWLAEDVPQCGFCQSGQIVTAAALLSNNPQPSDADIDTSMSEVLCRCGTYNRVRKAIKSVSQELSEVPHE